jgi:hypothetical protein
MLLDDGYAMVKVFTKWNSMVYISAQIAYSLGLMNQYSISKNT